MNNSSKDNIKKLLNKKEIKNKHFLILSIRKILRDKKSKKNIEKEENIK